MSHAALDLLPLPAGTDGRQVESSLTDGRQKIHPQTSRPQLPPRAVFAVVSLTILAPCFWQPQIEATDLPSHLYNAWLYPLVRAGKLPGLSIAQQHTNVLADILLEHALSWWGPWWASHLLAAVSVLVFFWGVFHFVAALTRRQPWYLTPLIAMLAYGAVFRLGFLNFYLSLGLCLWAGALVLLRRRLYGLLALVLFALAVLAHPMPPGWLLLFLAYLLLARRLSARHRPLLFALAASAILAARLLLQYRLVTLWPSISLLAPDTWIPLGEDQMLIYGQKYGYVCLALLSLWLWWIVRLFQTKAPTAVFDDALFQLLLLSALASLLCPAAVELALYRTPASLLTVRASLLTAIPLCAVFAQMKPPKLEKAALAVAAAFFFSFAYVDERAINRLEARLQDFVAKLPPGQRLVAVLHEPSSRGIAPFTHILDRACIGRCFDYANYEPSTAQFRIRATQPNAYVLSAPIAAQWEAGLYTLSPHDPPLYQIHLCDRKALRFCESPLRQGQMVRADLVSILPELW
jgi:hypothetical protein